MGKTNSYFGDGLSREGFERAGFDLRLTSVGEKDAKDRADPLKLTGI